MSVERTLHSSVRREREKGKAEGLAEGKAQGLAEGLQQGLQQGKAEGAHENAIVNAKKMKADGMPSPLIAKYTGLSEEQVSAL